MYLMTYTRPGIAFAAGRVSQQMHKPIVGLWPYVKEVLRFIKETFTPSFLFNAKTASWRLLDTVVLTGSAVKLVKSQLSDMYF